MAFETAETPIEVSVGVEWETVVAVMWVGVRVGVVTGEDFTLVQFITTRMSGLRVCAVIHILGRTRYLSLILYSTHVECSIHHFQ